MTLSIKKSTREKEMREKEKTNKKNRKKKKKKERKKNPNEKPKKPSQIYQRIIAKLYKSSKKYFRLSLPKRNLKQHENLKSIEENEATQTGTIRLWLGKQQGNDEKGSVLNGSIIHRGRLRLLNLIEEASNISTDNLREFFILKYVFFFRLTNKSNWFVMISFWIYLIVGVALSNSHDPIASASCYIMRGEVRRTSPLQRSLLLTIVILILVFTNKFLVLLMSNFPSYVDTVKSYPNNSPNGDAAAPVDASHPEHHSENPSHPDPLASVKSKGKEVAYDNSTPATSSPRGGHNHPALSSDSIDNPAQLEVTARSLTPEEVKTFSSTVLFGKLWGDDFVHFEAITKKWTKEWNFGRGGVTISFTGNGWFRIVFDDPRDRDRVWEGRPWFIQGLNFVLRPWEEMFIPFLNNITNVDQWVKIPFLPNEFWTKDYLSILVKDIGKLIRFDNYTNTSSGVALFARVCINVNIEKPVPRALKITHKDKSHVFFLSYEGVHEACPLCGSTDHSLKMCPGKPPACIELVVAKLEASKIQNDTPENPNSGWTLIKPKKKVTVGKYPKQSKQIPTPKPQNPQAINTKEKPQTVPTSNSFDILNKNTQSDSDKVMLQPNSSSKPYTFGSATAEDDQEFDEEFINQLGVIHHNPHLLIDADFDNLDNLMEEDAFTPKASPSEATKRRKREDGSPLNSN